MMAQSLQKPQMSCGRQMQPKSIPSKMGSFGFLEHWNAEWLESLQKGEGHIALDALIMALKYQYGSLAQGCAKGLSLRPDHGSQFQSKDYRNQMKYWGIIPSFSIVREPETNGVVERFHRTLKEQIIHGRVYQNVHEVELAVRAFIELYNNQWILEKLGYKSPLEARKCKEMAYAG